MTMDNVEYNRNWSLRSMLLSAVYAALLKSNSKELPESLITGIASFMADFLPELFPCMQNTESLEEPANKTLASAAINLRAGDIDEAVDRIRALYVALTAADPFNERGKLLSEKSYESLLYSAKRLTNARQIFIARDAASKIDMRFKPEALGKCPQLLYESAFREAQGAGVFLLRHFEQTNADLVMSAFDALIKETIRSGVKAKAFNHYWFSLASQKRAVSLKMFKQSDSIDAGRTTTEPINLRSLTNEKAKELLKACFASAQKSNNALTFLDELLPQLASIIKSHFTTLYRGAYSFKDVRNEYIRECLKNGEKYLDEPSPLQAAIELHKAIVHYAEIQSQSEVWGHQPNLRTAKALDRVLFYLSFNTLGSLPKHLLKPWESREQEIRMLSGEERASRMVDGLLTSLMEVAELLDERQMRSRSDCPGYDTAYFLSAVADAAINAGLAASALPFTEEQLLWEALCAPIEAEEKGKWARIDDPNTQPRFFQQTLKNYRLRTPEDVDKLTPEYLEWIYTDCRRVCVIVPARDYEWLRKQLKAALSAEQNTNVESTSAVG